MQITILDLVFKVLLIIEMMLFTVVICEITGLADEIRETDKRSKELGFDPY